MKQKCLEDHAGETTRERVLMQNIKDNYTESDQGVLNEMDQKGEGKKDSKIAPNIALLVLLCQKDLVLTLSRTLKAGWDNLRIKK